MANARTQPIEVVASAPDAPPAVDVQLTPQAQTVAPARTSPANPTFISSLRSWAAAPAANSTPAPAETASAEIAPQTAAELLPSAAAGPSYTVRAGDTLSQIAARFGTDTGTLIQVNKLSNPNVLVPGTQIVIPADATPAVSTQTPDGRPLAANVPAPAVGGPASPAEAVRSFYQDVNQGDFAQAAQLWSARMRSAYPPAEHINSRFARTQALTLSQADVVQVDPASGRATVAVRLSEVVGPPNSTREYVGSWYLVRGAGGWLLDQPSLQAN